jgi:hypothetical protein
MHAVQVDKMQIDSVAIIWVDNFMVCGPKAAIVHEKRIMGNVFPCDDMGPMEEYIGCKIEWNHEDLSVRLTQPVMLRRFQDEFNMTQVGRHRTPAILGSSLTKTNREGEVDYHTSNPTTAKE